MNTTRHRCGLTALAALAALAAGCAGAAPPNEKMAASEAAMRAAQEVGAPSVPRAALHLKFAREQMDHARALIKEGENERAEFVLMRAKADAELALALARQTTAEGDAKLALDQLQALRDRIR
jgi:hypothetical protein